MSEENKLILKEVLKTKALCETLLFDRAEQLAQHGKESIQKAEVRLFASAERIYKKYLEEHHL